MPKFTKRQRSAAPDTILHRIADRLQGTSCNVDFARATACTGLNHHALRSSSTSSFA